MLSTLVLSAAIAALLTLMVGWVCKVVGASYPNDDDRRDCDELDDTFRNCLPPPRGPQ